MTKKISRVFLAYFHNHFVFLLLLCILSCIFYYSVVQDTILTLSAITSVQYCACIWQFFIAPLELWAILLARGSNDVGRAKVQAKIPLYAHISACIGVIKYKSTC